jgi:non-specific serine/threonine protein kinase
VLAALPRSGGEAARKAVNDELTLRLPSAAGAPLASPDLIRPRAVEPGPRVRPSLASWRVPVLAFAPTAALGLLRAADHLADLAVQGASLLYLAALARFADGLAARGRVLPVLVAEGPAYAARWRPVLGGADAQRARDLAAAMPASCRAVGGEPPGAVAAAALDGLTDAAVRTRLSGPSCPRGAAVLRLTFLWPNDTWPH